MKGQIDQEKEASPLRELRERLGMSQQEFATHLGVGISSVGRWERGDRAISLTLPQIKALIELLQKADWDVVDFLDKATAFELAVS